MLQALDGTAARRWAELSAVALARDREAIDRINVYPVADGDTGTNLLRTMRSAVAAVDELDGAGAAADEPGADGSEESAGGAQLDSVLGALAKGALAGACGNSGMLLSQVLRGISEEVRGMRGMDGRCLSRALENAAQRAAQAVSAPQEGTLLTVLRAAARAGREAGDELATVVREATRASVRALERTTGQLPALAAAGVVDAGGRGLVILLDVLHAVVHDGARLAPETPAGAVTGSGAVEQHDSRYCYEVMYLLSDVSADAAARLREALAGVGDCVSVVTDGSVVAGGPGVTGDSVAASGSGDGMATTAGAALGSRTTGCWAVHVHCDDIGAVIESGIETGRVHDIRVTRFADQSRQDGPDRPAASAGSESPAPAEPVRDHAVLACTHSAELAELFRSEGASVLTVDPARAPGTDDVVRAVAATGAAHVLVLPNDETLTPVAEEAAGLSVRAGIDVVVVPTASPVQGLAALAVHDPVRRRADDTVALAEAAAATRRGELITAEREALTWVGYCERGDVLGLSDGEVVLIGDDPVVAACGLADRMLTAGGELVTALVGARTPEPLPDELARHLHRTHPEVEFVCYEGGDVAATLLLGVE